MAEPKPVDAINIEEVLRRDLGNVSLEKMEAILRNTQEVMATIVGAGPDESTSQQWTDVTGYVDRFTVACEQAMNLRVEDNQFHNQRNKLLSEFRAIWNQAGSLRGHAFALKGKAVDALMQEASSKLGLLEDVTAKATKAREDAEQAARKAMEAAQLTAVSKLAGAYSEEAKEHRNRARWWGGFSIITLLGAGIVVTIFVLESLTRASFSLSQAILRVAVVGILYGIFHLCLRTHQAYRHLEVVNRHRVNIGRTFEAFLAAQPTQRGKEIIGILTAQNMLPFGRSGLLAKDLSVQTPMGSAAEFLESITRQPQS